MLLAEFQVCFTELRTTLQHSSYKTSQLNFLNSMNTGVLIQSVPSYEVRLYSVALDTLNQFFSVEVIQEA